MDMAVSGYHARVVGISLQSLRHDRTDAPHYHDDISDVGPGMLSYHSYVFFLTNPFLYV